MRKWIKALTIVPNVVQHHLVTDDHPYYTKSDAYFDRTFRFRHPTKQYKTGYWISNSKDTFFSSKPVNSNPNAPIYQPILSHLTYEHELVMTDEEFVKTLTTGFFQVHVPEDLTEHIHVILRFLTSFSETKEHTFDFNQAHPEVYDHLISGFMIDGEKVSSENEVRKQLNQVWRLNLHKGPNHNFWKLLPPDVANALEHYKNFKMQVLNSILDKMDINPDLRGKITCGVSDGYGDEYALFNDFQPNITAESGLRSHRDYGIITALCSPVYRDMSDVGDRSGLEAYINIYGKNQWVSIVPHPNAIIFNFGSTLEKALEKYEINVNGFSPVKLHAAVHRVQLSATRRFSFANFGDPTLSSNISKLCITNGKQVLENHGNYSDHCIEENNKLYR